MKRLILMRHAKSSWGDPGLDDHARPLNDRGRKSSKALGNWLRREGYIPDEVLSSDALRTRETFAGLGLKGGATFLESLYHAGPERMYEVLRKAQGDCVLMLGHNPGIGWFAQDLVTSPPAHPRFHDYPTCATLVASFDISDWAELKPGTGKVLEFVIPRELTG